MLFLGTALLYRAAAPAATSPVQNGGKSFGQGFAAVSSLRKAGMKTLYPDFTLPENVPKIPFSGWAKRQKAPGTHKECPGHKVPSVLFLLRGDRLVFQVQHKQPGNRGQRDGQIQRLHTVTEGFI